jgi:four helix bundle protein
MKIEHFEDLIAWQKARRLTNEIYQATRQAGFAKDFGLSAQIQRAAVSIMPNIAEGFERNRFAEFHQFLSIAKGSCAEVCSHLYVALDAGYLNQKRFDELFAHAQEVGRLVGGLRASLKDRSKASTSSGTLTQHLGLSTQHL